MLSEKLILFVFIPLIAAAIVLSSIGKLSQSAESDKCTAKKGVFVKTLSGYACINVVNL